jgi:FRG domain
MLRPDFIHIEGVNVMTALEALAWMKRQVNDSGDNVLFRGQNRVWETIKPSITRDNEETMAVMWNICRQFQFAASGIAGYSIRNEHDRLAILQHYIGRSPVIDLTGTPEVALYFAFLNAEPGRKCVVYAVNKLIAASPEVIFSKHSFLAMPLQAGGAQHRWLRQDGYSVGPKEWRRIDRVQNFDLLRLSGVYSQCFTKTASDEKLISNLGDLEDIARDPLALRVRGVISSIIRSLNLETPEITKILEASKTRDPVAELCEEIDALISITSRLKSPGELLTTLNNLRGAVGNNWGTSFECTLDVTSKKVHKLLSQELQG